MIDPVWVLWRNWGHDDATQAQALDRLREYNLRALRRLIGDLDELTTMANQVLTEKERAVHG